MTREDVLKEFCNLSGEVAKKFGWKFPADCFCCASSKTDPNFQFSLTIMNFINGAVQEKLRRSK
jgi:hypothetical protein